MKIQFLGASQTVTGSRYLLRHGTMTVLVDCGLFQGFKNLRLRNWAGFPVPPSSIDAILLTHAHLDHSGYLPLLVKRGFRGPIYATKAAIDLCEILLPDSGFLQEEEARIANHRGYSKHHPAQPLYTAEDARMALELFQEVPWQKLQTITKKEVDPLSFEFWPAGHLLGAASIVVRAGSTSVAFSGDLGRFSDPMIRDPHPGFGADYLVMESTYGDRRHPLNDPEEEIREVVLQTYSKRGILLIPSFAVGRAQLVLYFLHQLKRKGTIPSLPIYLNSPMAAEANRAFAANASELKLSPRELQEIWEDVRIVSTSEESMALCEKTDPAIIIAASGMATGGRVLHHLKRLVVDPRNTILFVGFQAGGTRGDLMVRGADKIKIHGEAWPIRAKVVNLEGLSAHADADELLAWIGKLARKPSKVFVTHGEPEAADALRFRISEELGLDAEVPENLLEVNLA